MKTFFKIPLLTTIILFLGFFNLTSIVFAEESNESDPAKEESQEDKKKSLEFVVKDFDLFEGFIKAYQDPKTSSIYFSIKEDQLNKEFIYFAHVSDGVVAARRNRGSYLDNGVFRFERHFESIRLIRVNTAFSMDSKTALSKSSGANISNSVIKVFSIKAKDQDKKEFLINVSGLFLSESLTKIAPIPYPEGPPPKFKWGNMSSEKSRILALLNYPKNTDIEIEYVFENPPSWGYEEEDAADPRNISISLRYSFIEMPKNDFVPRLADQRVGYFTERITDLSSTDVTPYADLINRWDLKKKNPEQELSDPVKPITFWMENTTPIELRDYIREGVLAWNKAFESAGFTNALEVKQQPDDADWNAGDIRYNVLRWTSSPNPPFGGYGPSFTNPRTGEIIGADIMLEWVYLTNRINLNAIFPEVMNGEYCAAGDFTQEGNLLSNLVMNSLGKEMDKKIVRQSIIRLTLHEVGHTLGLNHNFKASFLHDPVSVHNPSITQEQGVTSSVMEYPAVNIAPLGIEQGDYYDVVPGAYDKWAIEFGYKPNLTNEEREEILFRSNQHELKFGNDADDMRVPGKGIDPRAMVNDMSSDPITYAAQRIELVNSTTEKLPNQLEGASTWEEYRLALNTLIRETGRSLNTISRYIGGVYVNRSTPKQESPLKPYEPVPYEMQKKAMKLLTLHAFSPNAFPVNSELLSIAQLERRGFDFSREHEDPKIHKAIMSIQSQILSHLLSGWTLDRITDSRLYGNTYNTSEMMEDLTKAIFLEDANSKVITQRQNLQALYVQRLLELIESSRPDQTSVASAHKALKDIQKIVKRRSMDQETQTHREFLLWQIESYLSSS